MTTARDPAVDAALAEVKRVRKLVRDAKAKYPALRRQLDDMQTAQLECTAENIQTLKDRQDLQQQLQLFSCAFHNGPDLVRTALRRLREVNGVETECYVNRAIGDLVMLRLAQGYAAIDVASMVGCSSSAVSSIKVGRYRYSEKPENANAGARSHRKPIYKPFDRAIEPSF
jgi:hypothetical protein